MQPIVLEPTPRDRDNDVFQRISLKMGQEEICIILDYASVRLDHASFDYPPILQAIADDGEFPLAVQTNAKG